jgi:hypothetical protein
MVAEDKKIQGLLKEKGLTIRTCSEIAYELTTSGECLRHGSSQCLCYMNIHEHTWTAVGCRPNSTCKASAKHLQAAKTSALASPRIHCQTGRSGSPLWKDLTKVISILNWAEDWHVPAGNRTRASTVGGEHSRIEPFEQLVDSYSEHLHISAWPVENAATGSSGFWP